MKMKPVRFGLKSAGTDRISDQLLGGPLAYKRQDVIRVSKTEYLRSSYVIEFVCGRKIGSYKI